MTSPATPKPTTRGGCLITLVLAALVAGAITAVVKLWPESSAERRDQAIDVCQTAVDERAPTPWRKLWQGVDVDGWQHDDGKRLTVTGDFSTKDSGFRAFTCVVEDGKLVSVQVNAER